MLIAVAKTGNIGASLVLELLLDERADRKDIDVQVVSSGAKMGEKEAQQVLNRILDLKADLILYATPNASTPGPKTLIKGLKGKLAIVVSDAPAIKAKELLEENKVGYILVKADAMIGARREFLDPTEMAIFNADILKILAGTGVIRLLQEELGKSITALKNKKTYLPQVIVTSEKGVEHAHYKDKRAREKAIKAYQTAEEVGRLNVKGCFIEKEPREYIKTVSRAHELLGKAAGLVDEAREIERKNDTLVRTPHYIDGTILRKTRLYEKPRLD